MKGVTLEIDYVSTRPAYYKRTISKQTSGGVCYGIGLTPQILRVCKTVHRDATPILYGENVFQFQLIKRQISWNPVTTGLDDSKNLCRELPQNSMGRWNDEAPDFSHDSTFAVFLREIGQQNAASVKNLKFVEKKVDNRAHAQQAGQAIQATTQLLKSHAPGVCQVKIGLGRDHWDGFEEGPFKPVIFTSTLVCLKGLFPDYVRTIHPEEQETMYKGMADMVREITWLKQLSVTGFDKDDPAYQKLQDLQTLVKTRR